MKKRTAAYFLAFLISIVQVPVSAARYSDEEPEEPAEEESIESVFREPEVTEEESLRVRKPDLPAEPLLFNIYLYMGFKIPSFGFEGDFDGENYLTDGNETVIIPKIERNNGFGLFAGARTNDVFSAPIDLAFELGYSLSEHPARWKATSTEAAFKMLYVNLRSFFKVEKKLYLFTDVGAYLSWINVKKGSTKLGVVDEAVFPGYGFTAGGGVSYSLADTVIVTGGANYNMGYYPVSAYADGPDKKSVLTIKSIDPVVKVDFLF